MKTKFYLVILLLTATVAHAQTNSLTSLLQQGLLDEQVGHDLNTAIADYQSLSTQFDKDRKVAATAIYRLGECYRMLGKTNEAASQYERIIREFSDQETLTTLSRQNLIGLGRSEPPAVTAATPNAEIIRELGYVDQLKAMSLPEILQLAPHLLNDPQLLDYIEKYNSLTNQGPSSLGVKSYKQLEDGLSHEIHFTLDGLSKSLTMKLTPSANTEGAPALDEQDQEIQRLKQVIQNSPDLINPVSVGLTPPLWTAASKGQLRVAQFLLANGAHVNIEYPGGGTPLVEAVAKGQNAMVKFLLDHGADVEAGNDRMTPLLVAVEHRYKAVTETLLAHHANVNAKSNTGHTALGIAAARHNLPMLQLVLAHGADPNVGNAQPSLFDALSYTNILKALLDAGAQVDQHKTLRIAGTDRTWTALDYAAQETNTQAVEFLLQRGANPNIQDEYGDNALHCAALGGAGEQIFSLLLDYNANPNVRDKNDDTPLDLVKQNNASQKLIDLFLQHGALENLPHWDEIIITRSPPGLPTPIFHKGTNDWNRFTLLETIYNFYYSGNRYHMPDGYIRSPGEVMPFPDLKRIAIERPDPASTNRTRIPVDLLNSTNGIECSRNVPLEFGDVVEIPERDHSLGDTDSGLGNQTMYTISVCLKQSVELIVRDQKVALPVSVLGNYANVGVFLSENPARNIILSSSDLAHVKVTRRDPKTGQTRAWIVDCSTSRWSQSGFPPQPTPDLRLRDGDVIEVPEKSN